MGEAGETRRVPDGVAWVIEGDTAYVAVVPGGAIHVLQGTSGIIWDLATSGPYDTLVARVAESVDESEDAVADVAEAFVADLIQRGLVCP